MIFYKTSSFGNDFIEIDLALLAGGADPGCLAKAICDRQRGVGADGVVFYCPGRQAGVPSGDRLENEEFHFEIFNRDGGRAELSGNGMAGLAAVLFQRRLARSPLFLHAAIGARRVELLDRRGPVFHLNVEIGRPDFSQRRFFPFLEDKRDSYEIDGLEFYPVSVGNPHAVVLCPDALAPARLAGLGKKLESHPWFPGRVNVEFVHFEGPEAPQTGSAASRPASPPKGSAALRPASPPMGSAALRPASPPMGSAALRPASPPAGSAALRPASPPAGSAASRPASCRVFFYERGVGPTLASSTGSAAVFAVLRRLGMVGDRLDIDLGPETISLSWKQGIFIHNITRLICRGEYFL